MIRFLGFLMLIQLIFCKPFDFIPPSEDADAWCLAFIDVETTGLIPGYHEMIDIGVVLATLEGEEINRTFIRILPDHPERTSPEVPDINGFNYRKWVGYNAMPIPTSVDSLINFYNKNSGNRQVLMVAFNSHFDAAFVDFLFRAADKSWRELHYYFILDLPSMAWSLGMRHLTGSFLSQILNIPDEPHEADDHTGITGADLNFRIYKALLEINSKTE